jgi:hypothetical protein
LSSGLWRRKPPTIGMEAVVEDTRRREFERRHGGARDSPPGYHYKRVNSYDIGNVENLSPWSVTEQEQAKLILFRITAGQAF